MCRGNRSDLYVLVTRVARDNRRRTPKNLSLISIDSRTTIRVNIRVTRPGRPVQRRDLRTIKQFAEGDFAKIAFRFGVIRVLFLLQPAVAINVVNVYENP